MSKGAEKWHIATERKAQHRNIIQHFCTLPKATLPEGCLARVCVCCAAALVAVQGCSHSRTGWADAGVGLE